MKPRHAAAFDFFALRYEMARAQQRFLETDLSLAATFAHLAKWHYKDVDLPIADRCKGHAEVAIRAVRYFIATTELLSATLIDSVARVRCDELEERLSRG
jgi:hypothetical protein